MRFISLVLIAVNCLLTVSDVAEAVCLRTEVDVHAGEALVACSLTTDVSKTKHPIAIKQGRESVLHCAWPEDDKPTCVSSFGFELVGNVTNCVRAKIPVARLQTEGSYMCQLVPPLDFDDPFTACEVIKKNTGGLDGLSAVEVPEVLTREHQTPTPVPPEKDVQTCDCKDGECQGKLVSTVVALTFIIWFLLMLDVVVIVFICQRIKRGSTWAKVQTRVP